MKTVDARTDLHPADEALMAAVRVIRNRMIVEQTPRLSVKVHVGNEEHTYEFRLMKVVAKFQINASSPGSNAAPDGRKPKKGNTQWQP